MFGSLNSLFGADRRGQRRHVGSRGTGEQFRNLAHEPRRQERLVALDVDDDLPVVPAEALGEFRNPIGAARVVGARHFHPCAVLAACRNDPFVIACNDHLARARTARLFVDPGDHRPARDIRECLARQAGGSIAGPG